MKGTLRGRLDKKGKKGKKKRKRKGKQESDKRRIKRCRKLIEVTVIDAKKKKYLGKLKSKKE